MSRPLQDPAGYTVWVAVIRHSDLDEGEQEVTVHATRDSAQKEVDCTASALAVEWPPAVPDGTDPGAMVYDPDEATLGGAVGDWMTYKITEAEVQP